MQFVQNLPIYHFSKSIDGYVAMFVRKYRGLSVDSKRVQSAANVLHVTEFRLFELAYRDWFGTSCQEGELERIYMLYWFSGLSPAWVRHYCRHTLSVSRKPEPEVKPVTVHVISTFQIVTLGCLAMSLLLLLTVV